MKLFILIIYSLFIPFQLKASFDFKKLRVGDLLLQNMDCYVCRVIASETRSPFSHMGIIIKIKTNGEVMIAESFGKVRMTELSDFMKRSVEGEKLDIYRFKEFGDIFQDFSLYEKFKIDIATRFKFEFENLPYDSDYLWGNYTKNGYQEKLYCSELITKLINPYLKNKIKTSPMNYLENWDFWNKYMGHSPPQGLPGNNPKTFTNPRYTFKIGDI